MRKLERFNVEQVFALYEKGGEDLQGSPQKSPQSEMSQNGQLAEVVVN
jgi:hypothetical protein